MGDLRGLAYQAAEALLIAIRDQARTAVDLKLLQLAQAYSMIVSTEVSTRLADVESTRVGEYASGFGESNSPDPE